MNCRVLIALLFVVGCVCQIAIAQDPAADSAPQESASASGSQNSAATMIQHSPGRVLFRAGTHRLTETLEIDLSKQGVVHIEGEGRVRLIMTGSGPAIRIVGTHGGTAAPETVKPEIWQKENAPIISDLEIVGEHPEADGIELTGTMQATLTDLTIRKTRHAIRLTKRNRNVNIADCQIYQNSGAGIYYDHVSLHQSNITGCHISYCDAGGIVIRGGDVRNVHITGCDIEGNMGGPEAPPAANVLLDSEEGSIGEVAITGCTIQHTHAAQESANIWINLQSNPQRFTPELRHGNVTISGNILSDAQYNIRIAHCRGVAITGNTIWKGYAHNVWLKDCEAIAMTGNAMDRNPRYHYGNGPDAKLGILVDACKRCTLVANTINGVGERDAAVELRDSSQILIGQTTFTGFPKAAILLTNSSHCAISNCSFELAATQNPEQAIQESGGMQNQFVNNLMIVADEAK